MRKVRIGVIAVVVVAASCLFAQRRVSPHLDRSGGSAYLVTFRAGADMESVRARMREFGFDLIDHPDLLPRDLVAAGPRKNVARLAEWDQVAYIRAASPALLTRQKVIGCGGAVLQDGGVAEYAEVGRGWPKRNGTADLRYIFHSVTDKLEEGAARAEIERGLHEWEKYANVTFTAGGDIGAARTIAIQFAKAAHGDSYPFDGSRGSLAHTFFPAPPNPEPIAGDMHFDGAESWNIGANIDLYSVALHEAGHALGLAHSDQPGAVMYPYYHQASGLTSDDIAGIQALYGERTNGAPVTPPVAPPVTPPNPPVTPPPTPSTDKTPPAMKVTSPPTTVATTTAARFTLTGTASDDTGVTEVRWTSSTGDSGVASGTTNWTVTAPVYIGTTTITVRAYDAAGNSAWRAITVTRR